MNADQPGALYPDVDIKEVLAEVKKLSERVEGFIHGSSDPQTLAVNTAHRRTAFVVMPFGIENLQVVYDDYIKPTIEQCGLDSVRGDDMFGSNVIMEDIRSAISASGLIVADLTGQNANVFYEVGIAHGIKKPVLLLAQSLDDVPFDLRHRRVLLYEYSVPGVKRFEQRLKDHLLDMLSKAPNKTLPGDQ